MNLENLKTIGERIEYIAHTYFDGVGNLSKELKLKPTSLYNYINNKRSPGTVTLKRFSELGFTSDWILRGTGEIFSSTDVQIREVKEDENYIQYKILVPKASQQMFLNSISHAA
jgi:hypothetical protein